MINTNTTPHGCCEGDRSEGPRECAKRKHK